MLRIIDDIWSALVGGAVTKFVEACLNDRGYLKLATSLVFKRKDKIRLSCAYLFRIKDGNKYLLIKGKHIDQYQPVGGVYKTFESFEDVAHKYDITTEREEHFFEDKDLRVYMPGKNVMKFIRWFNTGEGREVNVTREFCEELVEPGFLPIESVLTTKFKYIKQVHSDLHWSSHFQCREVLVHNIFEVVLNDEYKEMIKTRIRSGDHQFIFVDQQTIEKEAVYLDEHDVKIGAHAKSIL